jgi:two-component system osmolarity sensor histidine kinase EnvZ
MLAGVSHDLRTPITRLKLRLAMMPQDDDVAAVAEDVAEMEQMVEGFLAFARGAQAEAAEPVDLARLLDEVADAARERGAEVETMASGDLVVSVRRQALKRCLTNLVENARRHGTRLALSAVRQTRQVEITIDDNGPGIPEADREAAFRPFVRLDAGRNLDQGGVGLGLAIARDVVRLHGGEITLGDSPMGGLRARISLPA